MRLLHLQHPAARSALREIITGIGFVFPTLFH